MKIVLALQTPNSVSGISRSSYTTLQEPLEDWHCGLPCTPQRTIWASLVVQVGNRFKGLGLIDREPDELWTEVRDIAQETGIKTIPKEKKCKKAKWLSEDSLQIAVKRRKAKSKGEKKRYSHLNAELQRIARRDKKAFLSNQCKEIEENNRMGKTRDLFKKIRDTK